MGEKRIATAVLKMADIPYANSMGRALFSLASSTRLWILGQWRSVSWPCGTNVRTAPRHHTWHSQNSTLFPLFITSLFRKYISVDPSNVPGDCVRAFVDVLAGSNEDEDALVCCSADSISNGLWGICDKTVSSFIDDFFRDGSSLVVFISVLSSFVVHFCHSNKPFNSIICTATLSRTISSSQVDCHNSLKHG